MSLESSAKNHLSDNEIKAIKFEKIDNILDELGMTKLELVDLIQAIFQEGKEKNNPEQQVDLEVINSGEISSNNENIAEKTEEELLSSLDVREREIYLSLQEHDKAYILENFSSKNLDRIYSSLNFAKNMQKAKSLGVVVDDVKLSAMISLKQASFGKNGMAYINGNANLLSKDQLSKANSFISDQVKQQFQQNNKAQDSSKSALSKISVGLRDIGKKTINKLKDTIHKLDHSDDILELRETAKKAESSYRNLKKTESKIKSRFSEVESLSYKGKQVFAKIEGQEEIVNFEDYLRSEGKLDAISLKLISDAGSSNFELMKSLGELNEKLGDLVKFSFRDGKLFAEIELKGTKSRVHINDYLNDIERMEAQIEISETKKIKDNNVKFSLDAKTKKEGKSFSQREGQLSSNEESIEIDGGSDSSGGSEQESDKEMPDLDDHNLTIEEKEEKTIQGSAKKEAEKEKSNVIKQDIIADKAKMIDEMQEVNSLLKEGMKGMKEAMKNKDLVDKMKEELQLKNLTK